MQDSAQPEATTFPDNITTSQDKCVFGAPEGQDARFLSERAQALSAEKKILLHIALDDARAAVLEELIGFFAPEIEVVVFPAWDCLPYDRVSPNADIAGQRVSALCRILDWQSEEKFLPRIVLTTVNAVTQRVLPQSALKEASFSVRRDGALDQEAFTGFLIANGYIRTDTVREAGEYAVRGGIIDVFPSASVTPVRIDLFGDEVESIKSFDPVTQLTQGSLDYFSLKPVSEFFLNEDSIQKFRSSYRESFGAVRANDPLYEAVSEGRRYNGMEHWLPLFYEQMETLFDYLPDADITRDHHSARAAHERFTQIEDFYQARKTLETATQKQNGKKGSDVSLSGSVYHPLVPERLYLKEKTYKRQIEDSLLLVPFAAPEEMHEGVQAGGRTGRDFADIRALPDGDVFGELKIHIASLAPRKILIACYSDGALSRVKTMLENAEIKGLQDVSKFEKLKAGRVGLGVLALEHGFVSDDLAVITEQDILGDRLARKTKKRKAADNFLTEVSSLEPGDLVVHIDHGVGRFESLETLDVSGVLHDCLKLVYHADDKLYVPVENIDVLSRFGSDEGFAQLDRLGGAGWQARKSKVKKDLMAMADGLLKIAAARQLRKGESLHIDKAVYDQFAARFPYAETDDQLRSINDVIDDLAGGQPMDRLVCGDVGFGKTEVALRAAYVAAMSGAQVALVVPTTLLARQHTKNFLKRFEGMGLRIGQLSRMVSTKEAKETKEGLADGSVNIVIGTHALLSKDIKFAHLGLVIVDEEQRFGVKQKEKLKELKSDVHVLTLTATPIPRTLQMSLTGVKEMSLITTPPVDRLAIRTFVLPYDPMVIREALLREHYRGGQSFYVCPRISDIKEVEEALKELVPEVKVIAAHGQMPAGELDDKMTAFYDGQYDVLLATNIIESGIDIPTANTMIVHRADMFGLAQLYQIRGRIGRSKVRAYAYLTYQPDKKLTAQGQKRLEVIETLDTLGAGFQLASHDMDIRGAGNLLGEEQSGHIKEVGVELYQHMLEEAVATARAGVDFEEIQAREKWSPNINLGTSVLIPETYVEDLSVRMSLYRRLADLENKDDIDAFAAELIDRFGKLPAEVDNLLDIVAIKQLCKSAGVDRVEAGPKGATIGFYKDTPPNVPALMTWIEEQRGAVKLRPDQKIGIIRSWEDTPARVKGIQSLVKELSKLKA